jgi:phage shock protein PspC (stress-responsive transcriptional regulator)
MGDIMEKKLCLSRDNKVLAGVCGGIAEYFGVDPTLIRIIWVLMILCLFGAPPLLLYVICWAVMPLRD